MPDFDLDPVLVNARHCLTWAAICQHYLQRNPKDDFRQLLVDLLDAEQAAISELTHLLRQHDVRPGDLGVFTQLLQQARARRTDQARMHFIQQGLEHALKWYAAQAESSDPRLRDLWQRLHDQLVPIENRFSAILSQARQ